MIGSVFIVVVLVTTVTGIPVDNGVIGEPIIKCGPFSVGVEVVTENQFQGHIYVKGLYSNTDCRNDERSDIELPFDDCNLSRTRSLNPNGIYVTTTIVVSFHPLFITKVDRAYKISCFYMEADKKVTNQYPVSEITPPPFDPSIPPMPVCKYEILDGGPTGEIVNYALIGQQVYHKWTCQTETDNTFCMRVYSCFVDDGKDENVELIDKDGCALDKYLLNNLQYPTDLMAGVEAHVFKYADRPQLYFQCQISITVKPPSGQCPKLECRLPVERRIKRSSDTRKITDVRTEIKPIEISEDQPNKLWMSKENVGICLAEKEMLLGMFLILLLSIVGVVVAYCRCTPK